MPHELTAAVGSDLQIFVISYLYFYLASGEEHKFGCIN